METRVFGKTNANITLITMGGCGLGYVDQNEADKAVKLAMDHGINMIDVAPTYGKAEERLRPWIQKYRDKFFLAEKTMKRTKKGAWRQLNRSLERLDTTYFDLYQFHAVSSMEELDQILGKDGAMEAFKEAKETGIIKHIGITGHDDVRILQKAITLSDDFDTVLLPVYVASLVNPNPVNDFKSILQITREKNIGVTAIKAISKNRWKGDSTYNTWYEPLDKQEFVNQAVWFTLSQDGVTTYSLPCDVKLWPLVLNAVKLYKKLDAKDLEKIVNIARENELQPLFPE
ncbi:MAG: aldo/keto reductase [Candidatus Lokiarchaeota archaeon]|nr:aldo/keto reductase [Candidatus Lokiarchaeota archaeon]